MFEIPTFSKICQIEKEITVPRDNKTYQNWKEYLEAHYWLMYNNFFISFWNCIQEVKEKKSRKYVYCNLIFYTCEAYFSDVIFTFKFKTEGQKIVSEFLPGNLVCLSSDDFYSGIIATIYDRDVSEENIFFKLKIKKFEENIDVILKSKSFSMIESPIYFKHYESLLQVLCKGNKKLPFMDEILSSNSLPMLLEPLIPNITHLIELNFKKKANKYTVKDMYKNFLNKEKFSQIEVYQSLVEVNNSQLKSLHSIQAGRISLIQGPPGTGKSYLGKLIIKLLLSCEYYDKINFPILIACFRNDALDSTLEDCLEYTQKIIRIGSQSLSLKLKSHNLFSIQEKFVENKLNSYSIHKKINEIIFELSQLREKLNVLLILLQVIKNQNGIIKFLFLKNSTSLNTNFIPKFFIYHKKLLTWLQISNEEFLDSLQTTNLSECFFKASSKSNVIQSDDICTFLKSPYSSYAIKDSLSVNDSFDSLSLIERWEIYFTCVKLLEKEISKEITCLNKKRSILSSTLKDLEYSEYYSILKNADIVGITITGAAIYHNLIKAISPRVIIVEEAGVISESHFIPILIEGCKHLILIGDHKQLKPQIATHKLEEKSNLDVSLFERLINNGHEYTVLEDQFRMRKEISRFLVPVYPELKNHNSVLKYGNVIGIKKNVFFFNHQSPENIIPGSASKFNEFEAMMIMNLAEYLLYQGYSPKDITIVCLYIDQISQMKKHKSIVSNELSQINVVSLDGYQGQENKIILLSLIRNNKHNIGFLKEDNRITVALSRAKVGFYIFGNIDLLNRKSQYWKTIHKMLLEENEIDSALPFYCPNHPSTITYIKNPDDFIKVKYGGCSNETCVFKYDCGHICNRNCHTFDIQHVFLKCKEKVSKCVCSRNHMAEIMCSKKCENCRIPVQKHLSCGHTGEFPCYLIDLAENLCQEIVMQKHACGHSQQVICSMKVKNCMEPCNRVKKLCSTNEHFCDKNCSEECDFCMEIVKKVLKCGHEISCICSQLQQCMVKVEKILPCSHAVTIECSADVSAYLCKKKCLKMLSCNHKCKKFCYEDCEPCIAKTKKKLTCGHVVKLICSESPSDFSCSSTCDKTLVCGHKCTLPCGETCSCDTKTCSDGRNKPDTPITKCESLLRCGHLCEGSVEACIEKTLHVPCKKRCSRKLVCGHWCQADCMVPCPPCTQTCTYQCPHSKCKHRCADLCIPCKEKCQNRCEHIKCKRKCGLECSVNFCEEECSQLLSCKHNCVGFCGQECPVQCNFDGCNNKWHGDDDVKPTRLMVIPSCKHIFSVKQLEALFATDSVGSVCCPQCSNPILYLPKFKFNINQRLSEVHEINDEIFMYSLQKKKRIQNLEFALKNSQLGLESFAVKVQKLLKNDNFSMPELHLTTIELKFLLLSLISVIETGGKNNTKQDILNKISQQILDVNFISIDYFNDCINFLFNLLNFEEDINFNCFLKQYELEDNMNYEKDKNQIKSNILNIPKVKRFSCNSWKKCENNHLFNCDFVNVCDKCR